MEEDVVNNNTGTDTPNDQVANSSDASREGQAPYGKPRRDFREKRSFRSEDGSSKPRGFGFKKKRCRFCGKEKKEVDKELNYKNIEFLQKFVTDSGKLLPGRVTGTCFLHQKKVQLQVKRARYMAFLPFTKVEKVTK